MVAFSIREKVLPQDFLFAARKSKKPMRFHSGRWFVWVVPPGAMTSFSDRTRPEFFRAAKVPWGFGGPAPRLCLELTNKRFLFLVERVNRVSCTKANPACRHQVPIYCIVYLLCFFNEKCSHRFFCILVLLPVVKTDAK